MASVVLLSCLALGCQRSSGPEIRFTRVPRAGEGGPERVATIEGRVTGARAGERIVLFAHWGAWYVQPLADQPFTAIQPDSTWRNTTHFGSQYAALLVDGSYEPPASTDSVPSTGHGVVATAVVNGRPVFWQTWWFLLCATLASAGIVAAYFLQRIVLQRRSEEKLRDVIDTLPALAWITRADGYCTFVNRGWMEYTGLSAGETAGSGWQAAVHRQDLDHLVGKWRAALTSGETLEHETRIRRAADGSYRWFLMRATPLRDKHGRTVKWCGAATDIEDRKRAEQLQADLTHVNRVSTMGELVASISHELLQPITAATLNARTSLRWLQRDPPDLARARHGAEKIIEEGNLAAEIIDRLRSLYRKAPPKRELVAINEVAGEMAGMLRSEAGGHGVSIRTDLRSDLPTTMADRVQLRQVLMNLMLNGIEAMGDTGGVLTVRTVTGEDGMIEVSVEDTGPGLPSGEAGRIFEAFFTTKPQGSGMGLSISRSIVEAHAGRIWASGNEGRGATFHFTLPAGKGGDSAG